MTNRDPADREDGPEPQFTPASTTPPVPPPRRVPMAVSLHLLASFTTLFGAGFFALSSLIGSILLFSTDPVGSYRLAQRRATAPAWLEQVEKTAARSNGKQVWRHEYRFRLPDGTAIRGTSYSTGRVPSYPMPIPGGPRAPSSSSTSPETPRRIAWWARAPPCSGCGPSCC